MRWKTQKSSEIFIFTEVQICITGKEIFEKIIKYTKLYKIEKKKNKKQNKINSIHSKNTEN